MLEFFVKLVRIAIASRRLMYFKLINIINISQLRYRYISTVQIHTLALNAFMNHYVVPRV